MWSGRLLSTFWKLWLTIYQTTWHHIPEDSNHLSYRCENLKSHSVITVVSEINMESPKICSHTFPARKITKPNVHLFAFRTL
jgi:hypothetical protein